MPTLTIAEIIRAQLQAARERMTTGLPIAVPSLRRIAQAMYEFNRKASVTALRSLETAGEADLCLDISENIRFFLQSSFEATVKPEVLEEMALTCCEICHDLEFV